MYTYPRWWSGFKPSTSRSWRWPLKISRFCRVFVHQADVIDRTQITCTCKLMVGKTIFSFCGFMKTPRFMCKLTVSFSESIFKNWKVTFQHVGHQPFWRLSNFVTSRETIPNKAQVPQGEAFPTPNLGNWQSSRESKGVKMSSWFKW